MKIITLSFILFFKKKMLKAHNLLRDCGIAAAATSPLPTLLLLQPASATR
jgi:hypothetical protein